MEHNRQVLGFGLEMRCSHVRHNSHCNEKDCSTTGNFGGLLRREDNLDRKGVRCAVVPRCSVMWSGGVANVQ